MITIKQSNIIDLKTDAIVNAANEHLWSGGGVCGAIFAAAGPTELAEACRKIGHCDTGKAVITDGFALCKYIIHAVGPIYVDGEHNEAELLYSCYQEALNLAKEYKCKSVGFPIISSGIYAYPSKQAWQVAIKAITDWQDINSDDIEIIFAVLEKQDKDLGLEVINNM